MTAATVVTRLASGEPPINFAAHQVRAGNIAGAREDFEQMLAMLVATVHPGARLIAANPGDWGIDVLLGELSGLVVIWQAKYFWPLVGRSQQQEIRRSFASAVGAADRAGYRISRWVLCVPSSMDAPTAQWWDGWRARKQRETGVAIDVWDETGLRTALIAPEATDVRRHYYDPYQPTAPRARVAPEAVPDRPGGWGEALFVRQLRAAGHVEVAAAIRDYASAELVVREIMDKGLPAEVDALGEAEALVHGIWEAGFNDALPRVRGDPIRPGLYVTVLRDLRAAVPSLPSILRLGPVHCCGMMHRLVEQRRAGWVVDWREIARQHAAGPS